MEVEVPVDAAMAAAGQKGTHYMKKIVKNATGYASPGQATYIMGASGAGKTSLLNILADRMMIKGKHNLEGQVMFNDTLPMT